MTSPLARFATPSFVSTPDIDRRSSFGSRGSFSSLLHFDRINLILDPTPSAHYYGTHTARSYDRGEQDDPTGHQVSVLHDERYHPDHGGDGRTSGSRGVLHET